VEAEDRDGGSEPDAFGALSERRKNHRRIGHHAVLVEVMLGAEERVVTELFGELALAHHLGVELGNGARKPRVMVVDRKDREPHKSGADPDFPKKRWSVPDFGASR
jgi:hypothetical protein